MEAVKVFTDTRAYVLLNQGAREPLNNTLSWCHLSLHLNYTSVSLVYSVDSSARDSGDVE